MNGCSYSSGSPRRFSAPAWPSANLKHIHEKTHRNPVVLGVMLPVGALVGAVLLARFLGGPIRRGVLIETPRVVPTATPEAVGARREGDLFFVLRDSVHVQLERDIRVGEFLDLYHLRNTRGIRGALEAQQGVSNDADLLRAGMEIRLHLTVPTR